MRKAPLQYIFLVGNEDERQQVFSALAGGLYDSLAAEGGLSALVVVDGIRELENLREATARREVPSDTARILHTANTWAFSVDGERSLGMLSDGSNRYELAGALEHPLDQVLLSHPENLSASAGDILSNVVLSQARVAYIVRDSNLGRAEKRLEEPHYCFGPFSLPVSRINIIKSPSLQNQ